MSFSFLFLGRLTIWTIFLGDSLAQVLILDIGAVAIRTSGRGFIAPYENWQFFDWVPTLSSDLARNNIFTRDACELQLVKFFVANKIILLQTQ